MNKKILLIPLILLLGSCTSGNNSNGNNNLNNNDSNNNSSVNGGLSNTEMATVLKDVADEIITSITAAPKAKSVTRSIEHKHEISVEEANEITIAPAMVYMAGLMYEQSFYRPCEEVITWTNKLVQSFSGQSNEVDMSLKMHAEANPEEGKIYVLAYQTVKLGEMTFGENIPCAFDIDYNFETNSLSNYSVYSGTNDGEGNMVFGFASYEDGKYYHDDRNADAYAETQVAGSALMAKIDEVLAKHEHVASASEEDTLTDIYIAAQDHANTLLGNTTVITTKR